MRSIMLLPFVGLGLAGCVSQAPPTTTTTTTYHPAATETVINQPVSPYAAPGTTYVTPGTTYVTPGTSSTTVIRQQ